MSSVRGAGPDALLGSHAVSRAALGCAAVAVVASVLGLAVTGAAPWAVAGSSAVAVGAALLLRGSRAGAQLVGALGAVAALVWLPGLVAGRGALAVWPVLAVALAVRQFAVVRSARDVRSVLGLAVLVSLAAAGISPSAGLVGPAALVWVSASAGTAFSVPHRPVDAALVRRVASGLGVAAVVASVVFLLVPAPQGGAVAGWASAAASGSGAAGRGADGQEAVARSAQAYAGGTLDLSSRGELAATPLLRVPAASPQLWRAGVLDVYDGRTWSVSAPLGLWTPTATGWASAVEDGASARERTDRVVPLGSYDAVVSAGSPVALRPVPSSSQGPLSLRDDGSGVSLSSADVPYDVVSRQVPSLESDVVRVSGTAGPLERERWVQLPADLPRRVRDLGVGLVASSGPTGAQDPVAAARAVSAYLREHERYALDAPVPQEGADAVERFLFVDRVGFCEQFASAEVVLLRSAGVPARLVTGFSGGAHEGGERVLRAQDAHAWVEVWVPGTGWVSSDPTAGAALAGAGSGSWWQRAWSWVQRSVSAVLDSPAARAWTAGGVLAGAALVGWFAWWSPRRRRRSPQLSQVPVARRGDASVVALLVAVDGFEAVLDPSLRRGASEGVSSWRERLAGAGPAGVPGPVWQEARGALSVLERVCFARALPARGELQRAREALESASAAVLGLRSGPAASTVFVGG
ncbi:transglutaminase-like putative cysteine protease [Kineococcus rhizosphaerae]|uniref:Transglutaminase-like putative cysteine protease n=1 Tax=Kineococcus rhizosphaerae TaxID=559628 RepID=A0A2T0RAJ7_9ACTN|nr:transglutaminase-like putative cysteine protease [Kineococcus rhizosphaerae]